MSCSVAISSSAYRLGGVTNLERPVQVMASAYMQEREESTSSRLVINSNFYWRNSPRGVLRIRWIFSSAPVEAFRYKRYSSP